MEKCLTKFARAKKQTKMKKVPNKKALKNLIINFVYQHFQNSTSERRKT